MLKDSRKGQGTLHSEAEIELDRPSGLLSRFWLDAFSFGLTFCEEGSEGKCLSHAPVNILPTLNHFAPVLVDLLQAAVALEVLRQLCDGQTHL